MKVRKVRVRSESGYLKNFNKNLRTWTREIHYFCVFWRVDITGLGDRTSMRTTRWTPRVLKGRT